MHFSVLLAGFADYNFPAGYKPVGYSALIAGLRLPVSFPETICVAGGKNPRAEKTPVRYFPQSYLSGNTVSEHLRFALKYEGIHLLILKKLFETLSAEEVKEIVLESVKGKGSRKIWFLYEWLMGSALPIEDLPAVNYIRLAEPDVQITLSGGERIARQKIINNLPGCRAFCPVIYRTNRLEGLLQRAQTLLGNFRENLPEETLLGRANGFLLLKDSRASFTLEGEYPPENKIRGWGNELLYAGKNKLTPEELIRLQNVLLEGNRFVTRGLRNEGGFIGEHHPRTLQPLPVHISARHQDVPELIEGLLNTASLLETDNIHPVLTSAAVAFGFVFIHPFEDGNGRVHRYLLQYYISKLPGAGNLLIPLTSAILEKENEYKRVLEKYSGSVLPFIKWIRTETNNIEVLNETADYYRYFDVTAQAEFITECLIYAIEAILPDEITFLQAYDSFVTRLSAMGFPLKIIQLLHGFLSQNGGKLSARARKKEFVMLTDTEVTEIEKLYTAIFPSK